MVRTIKQKLSEIVKSDCLQSRPKLNGLLLSKSKIATATLVPQSNLYHRAVTVRPGLARDQPCFLPRLIFQNSMARFQDE